MCLLLFHWMEKWSSCGRALEHLESSGIKVLMNALLYAGYVLGKNTEKYRNINP